MADDQAPRSVFRPGGISYVRIPAQDPTASASFYAAAFGWKVGGKPHAPSFEDGTGHVIGHWVTDLPAVGEAGTVVYVYVDDVHSTLEKVTSAGGSTVTPPYPEGDLWVATFRDPAGNVLGAWQHRP